jgi:hypothetical protein
MKRSERMAEWLRGYASGIEDHAIGAGFGYPDPSLSDEYRRGYVEAWWDADGQFSDDLNGWVSL